MSRFVKHISIIAILGISFPAVYASVIDINPYLSLETDGCKYIIRYSLMEDPINIETDSLEDADSRVTYYTNKVVLAHDVADRLDNPGLPELPFFSLNLPIPQGVTLENLDVTDTIKKDTITISQIYHPAQSNVYDRGDINIDQSYYGGLMTWSVPDYTISQPFYSHGAQGITVNVYPIHDNIDQHSIVISREGKIEINMFPLDVEKMIDEMSDFWDPKKYYPNPGDDVPHEITRPCYLIITPDDYANDINRFAEYKYHQGYTVVVDTLRESIMYSQNISNLIESYNDNYYLKYVLLVGTPNVIPFVGTNNNNILNPISDLPYACIQNSSAPSGGDNIPDVYVGRWPVRTRQELNLIISKTIATECALHSFGHTNVVLASDGKGQFERSNNWIAQTLTHYSTTILSDTNDINDLRGALESNPWMFSYRGNCLDQSIGGTFRFGSPSFPIDYIKTSNNHFYPIGLGFGDTLSNYYHRGSFGEKWVLSEDGGVSYWAPTTRPNKETETNLIKTLFRDLTYIGSGTTVGSWIYNACERYYRANPVIWREREIRKMLLFGDPSLRLLGAACRDNEEGPSSNRALPRAKEIDVQTMINEEEPVSVYSIDGRMIGVFSSCSIALENLSNGTFFVVQNTTQGSKVMRILK